MSSVLHVSLALLSHLNHLAIPRDAILKLYDRRGLSNIRIDFDEGKPWSIDKERDYRLYLNDVVNGSTDFSNPAYLWDNEVSDGEFEAYLNHFAGETFKAERTAYVRLHTLQGTKIPRLYGAVEYDFTVPDVHGDGTSLSETTRGLLLEYVSPMSLQQLIKTWNERKPRLPNEVLVTLCDQAVKIVDTTSDFDVLNKDIRLDNFLVREPFLTHSSISSSNGHHEKVLEDALVLIDFGQCRLRKADEDESEWVQYKWSQDEEGAIGFVLQRLVRNSVGQDVWTYQRSLRYYRPLEE